MAMQAGDELLPIVEKMRGERVETENLLLVMSKRGGIMKTILAVNGSYRKNGITDLTVEAFTKALEKNGAKVETVTLRDRPIEFCRGCRECTQQPGSSPGQCVQNDAMASIIDAIERADGYLLASPTYFYSTTAIFKRFQERLLGYAYWPWEMNSPKMRKDTSRKKSIIVSSCAAPGLMGRLFYQTHKQLRVTAKTMGANVVASLSIGMIAKAPHPSLPERSRKRIDEIARRLL